MLLGSRSQNCGALLLDSSQIHPINTALFCVTMLTVSIIGEDLAALSRAASMAL